MEVHHHPHPEKKTLKEYLLEGLMIFLAVSMGFIAENIREHIAEGEKEIEYMKSLVDDIADNKKVLLKQISMYYATRDKQFKTQMLGVAVASGNTDFRRSDWKNISMDSPILNPKLPWEGQCIEAASVIQKNGALFMFYAAAYNNAPQQIGLARSVDGIHWVRVDTIPFLSNGKPGEWNASESGHPHIFSNPSGNDYLFFQGNNDNGKTWYISNKKIIWNSGLPVIK
jgi:hypothetical protein